MAAPFYLALADYIDRLWPDSLLPRPADDAVGRIWFEPIRVQTSPVPQLRTGILLEGACELRLPGLDAVRLVFGATGATSRFVLELEADSSVRGRLVDVPIGIRVDGQLLRPATAVTDASGRVTDYVIDRAAPFLDIIVGTATVTLDTESGLTIAVSAGIRLPLCAIGDTGILVEGNIDPAVRLDDPKLRINSATLILPRDLPIPAGTAVSVTDAELSTAGFSGTVSLDLPLTYDASRRVFEFPAGGSGGTPEPATLAGFSGGLRHVGLTFDQNRLIGSSVAGGLVIPYFEEPVDVRMDLTSRADPSSPGLDVSIALMAGDPDGVVLTKDELLTLNLKSLAVRTEGESTALALSGGLQPLLMSSDGLAWPRLDVTDLYIDSTGKFKIKEAWLDLSEIEPLDLWGFCFELSRVGIGFEEARGRLWLDLSGSLRLIEQIPVGLGVEGFRLTWPLDLLEQVGASSPPTLDQIASIASQIEVEFDGIYLFYGVPGAVEFEGLIRFFKNAQVVGFAGDMALRVPASGFGAEAGLMIGMNMEAPPYPFLYVYFGVELPAGIPLGQSGLALKGALGMFGLNVAPDKTPEQNWYYDWYKRGPIVGAHPTNKWTNARDALALGVGVTITTADGYVKGTRGLLVLALPGPILIIEGRALVLNGLQPNAEPPLRALAVFDGRAGTVQFNVEAEATLVEDMVAAHGMLEAFFDFNDLTNWHLFLGQDEPRDRRIRADVLKLGNGFLFKADAYLMLDMLDADSLRSRMGIFVGFKPEIPDIGPLDVDFEATLEGDGLVAVRPEQLSGDVALSARIGLSTFGFSTHLTAHGDVATEGPDPFKVDATLRIELEPPWPLDPVDAELRFSWQSPPHPVVESPLAEVIVDSRLSPAGGTPPDVAKPEARRFARDTVAPFGLFADAESMSFDAMRDRAEASPVVHVDATPTLAFGQLMNSPIASFARHPDGVRHHYDVGLIRFTPSVTSVRLYEHRKRDPWVGDASDWRLVGSSDPADAKPMPGVWLCESDPSSPDAPAPRRLLLWSENPLAKAGLALGAGYAQFLGALPAGQSHAERLLDDYPDLMRCRYGELRELCVDFDGARATVVAPGGELTRDGLRIRATQRPLEVRTVSRATRGPRPRLDSARRRAVWLALRGEVAAFREFGRVTIARLLAWTRRLDDSDRARLRRRHPGLDWLWNWLFPRTTTHTCLWSGGYFDVRFPSPVHMVHIRLCEPAKWAAADLRARTRARRAARTFSELAETRKALEDAGEPFDPRACRYPATISVTATDTEWRIESEEGFDCLSFVRLGEVLVDEICYVTLAENERAAAAGKQCENNASVPAAPTPLQPGAYYRLEVATDVDAELNLDALPFDRSTVVGAVLVEAYEAVMGALGFGDGGPPKSFSEAAFFQTDMPPTRLRPYVKWSSPASGAPRFFRGDDVSVRFLRHTMQAMFTGDTDPLRIVLRDADGHIVEDHLTEWRRAASATLFAEEAVWADHRAMLGWPALPPKRDDVLVARRHASPPLVPRARYEILIATGSRGDPLLESGVRFSSTFVTSAFLSFGDLVASAASPISSITALARPSELELTAMRTAARRLARRRWEFERAEVDYRFERLLGGRQGLEDARQRLRREHADCAAVFRRIVETLSDLAYGPVAPAVTVRVLRDRTTGAAFGLWLSSPEPLEVREPVVADLDVPDSIAIDAIGRLAVTLVRRTGSTQTIAADVIADPDGSTVVVLALNGATLPAGNYELRLTYHRDLGDQVADIDHAYDRPVEMRNGLAASELGVVRFVIS